MRAAVLTAFGRPEVIEVRELPDPEPGPGELLVAVHASSVNPVDFKVRRAGSLLGVELPTVTGYDVSGVVAALGPGADGFAVGDEVWYALSPHRQAGAFAEYHVAPEEIVARKPPGLSHAEAAALPVAGATAWEAVVGRGRVAAGETVLLHGLGGVGLPALQIARAAGARVLATGGAASLEVARELGAELALDHRAGGFVEAVVEATGGRGADVVIDSAGGGALAASIPATAPGGRLVAVVDAAGDLAGAFERNLTLHFLVLEEDRAALDALAGLVEAGDLRPVVDSELPLEELGEAQRRLERGGRRGKVVVRVRPG